MTNCGRIRAITIPESVESIGAGAFADCKSLTELVFNARNCSFSGSANSPVFKSCPIKNVTIGADVEVLPDNLCNGFSKITNVELPQSLTAIGESAFRGCSKLAEITLPEKVVTIGATAFRKCTSLKSIVIPTGVTSIGNGAFSACSALADVTYCAVACTKAGASSSPVFSECAVSNVEIADVVTTLPSYLFYACDKLTEVEIPASVTTIGRKTFYNCKNLSTVVLTDRLTSIDSYAFSNTALTKPLYSNRLFVYMPKNYCGDYRMPDGIKTICGGAFAGCEELYTVTMPASLNAINAEAFKNCKGLTALEIPNSVTSISSAAFMGCASLSDVVIPNSVKSMKEKAFKDCTSLERVTISNALSHLRASAFENCSLVTELVLPPNLLSIDSCAFAGCTSLARADIPAKVAEVGNKAFYGCSALSYVVIPSSVTSIGDGVFTGCVAVKALDFMAADGSLLSRMSGLMSPSLAHVTIGDSTISIPSESFKGCTGLAELNIGENLISIGASAFADSKSMANIKIHASVPPASDKSIFGTETYASCTLYVPHDYYTRYFNADPWWNFANILAYKDGDDPVTPNDPSEYWLGMVDQVLRKGTVNRIPIYLENAQEITAFEFALTLPEGLTVATKGDKYMIELSDRCVDTHMFKCNQANNNLHIVAYSSANESIEGSEGVLMFISLLVDDNVAVGAELPMVIKEVELTATQGLKAVMPETTNAVFTVGAPLMMGDANGDGKISVTDITHIVANILGQTIDGFDMDAADLNGDGRISVTDITMIIDQILSKE